MNVSDSLRSVSVSILAFWRDGTWKKAHLKLASWLSTAVENVNVSDSLRSVCYYGEFVLACKSDFLRCRCQQCKREGDSKGQNEATKMSAKVDRPLLITSTLVHAPTSLLNAGVAQYLAVTKKLVTAKLCSSPHWCDEAGSSRLCSQCKLVRRVRLSLST